MSFLLPGGIDWTHVVLTLEDAAGRAVDAALRNLAPAAHRSLSFDVEDVQYNAAADARTPTDLVAALQDPLRASSVTFAAGFVWWLTRSGGLLATMLLGIPAWRHVDLLPVLAAPVDDEDDDEDAERTRRGDDETGPGELDDAAVTALFERHGQTHDARWSAR